jgi:hypothetical protein
MSLYMGKRDIFRVTLTGNLMLGEQEGSLSWPAGSVCPATGDSRVVRLSPLSQWQDS